MNLYNTLSRNTDNLEPLSPPKVKLYTCGLTVYSQPHIGNWYGYIYWDVLVRTLKAEGFEVERTQNYTDVGHLVSDDDSGEDKMEKGARREGITTWDVADKYIAIAEHEAYELLDLLRPDHLVRATDYIDQQIEFVRQLESKGFTYIIPEEGVYFDTSKLSDYGKLARLDIDGLEAGARVAISGKRNPTDFAIWKLTPSGQKRDMEWDSPWGMGFPGWHLECSVIARETLGDQIDIHTGGIDHIPVHHTNEIAQTEAVTGKQFSQIWLHNNHTKVNGTKMSKSLGNLYTLSDLADKGFSYDSFRTLVLSKHYQTEGNFTWEILESSRNRLANWEAMADLQWQPVEGQASGFDWETAEQKLKDSLSDNLNTPEALMVLDAAADAAQSISNTELATFKHFLSSVRSILGLHLGNRSDIAKDLKQLLADRQQARLDKDWASSDALRQQLELQGVLVKDTPNGQLWSHK